MSEHSSDIAGECVKVESLSREVSRRRQVLKEVTSNCVRIHSFLARVHSLTASEGGFYENLHLIWPEAPEIGEPAFAPHRDEPDYMYALLGVSGVLAGQIAQARLRESILREELDHLKETQPRLYEIVEKENL